MNIWQRIRGFFAQGVEIIRMIRSGMSTDPDAWEWAIARFEAEDRRQPPPRGAVVFTGSSSITFWDTLARDMAPLPVINRGFGGSRIDQVARYVDRIVVPYGPRAVVLFAGTNDISGRQPKTAQQVYEGYLTFVANVRAALPETPIYYISITPTPSRWALWPIAREANELIQTHAAAAADHLYFIDLTDAILGPDGAPRRELYRADKLHPNAQGYAVWTAQIRPLLLQYT
ncbi:MAG: GDSL-like Lipase/Acylhydrolase [Chloroflexi bacterium ADurb.Bin325]|nr:MAG: GDSL-like Lipase/Acylhydrolase [Chloroflexi bacterium ADurb.Bin325]